MDRRGKLDFPRKFGSGKKIKRFIIFIFDFDKETRIFVNLYEWKNVSFLVFSYVSVTKFCTTQVRSCSMDCIIKINCILEIDN